MSSSFPQSSISHINSLHPLAESLGQLAQEMCPSGENAKFETKTVIVTINRKTTATEIRAEVKVEATLKEVTGRITHRPIRPTAVIVTWHGTTHGQVNRILFNYDMENDEQRCRSLLMDAIDVLSHSSREA